MNFENHIFISYKSSEDQYDDMYTRWISEFIQHTETLLQRYFHFNPRIILSDNLPESDAEKLIENTALFIPILSTETLTSDYNAELELIRKALEKSGNPNASRERVLLAFRSCFSPDLIPGFLKGADEFDFCKLQAEYFFKNEVTDDEVKELFWMNMVNLAYCIYDKLGSLNAIEVEKPIESVGTVYLAPATIDKQMLRTQIEVELQHAGFKVLPGKELSEDQVNAKERIQEMIRQADAYVQLAGDRYGEIPEDFNYSLQDLHLRIVTTYNHEREQQGLLRIPQIMYLHPGMRTQDETQAKFIEQVKQGAEMYKGTDIFEGSFVRFRTFCSEIGEIISSKIERKQDGYIKKVYLATADTNGEFSDIKDFFGKNSRDFSLMNDPEMTPGYLSHWKSITESDIFIIYAKEGNNHWLEARLAELHKLQAYTKSGNNTRQNVVYLAGNQQIPGDLTPMNAKIIRDPKGFNADHLKFLKG